MRLIYDKGDKETRGCPQNTTQQTKHNSLNTTTANAILKCKGALRKLNIQMYIKYKKERKKQDLTSSYCFND